MSAPVACRPNPAGAIPVDEEELSRFRAWLVARGYAETTARLWTARVRAARAEGVEDPGAVDAAFANLTRETRGTLRAALREFGEFRGPR